MSGTIIWLGWCALMAWLPRALVVALLRRWPGPVAYLTAYATWPLLFLLGAQIVDQSGFQMYGFNGRDGWQSAGAFVMFFSPLGLPLLIGAPFIVIGDITAAIWRRSSGPALFAARENPVRP